MKDLHYPNYIKQFDGSKVKLYRELDKLEYTCFSNLMVDVQGKKCILLHESDDESSADLTIRSWEKAIEGLNMIKKDETIGT